MCWLRTIELYICELEYICVFSNGLLEKSCAKIKKLWNLTGFEIEARLYGSEWEMDWLCLVDFMVGRVKLGVAS